MPGQALISPPSFRPSEASFGARTVILGPVPKSPETRAALSTHKEFVGQNLTDARKAIRWSQAKLAKEWGIGQPRVNQWEAGLYYPDPWLLVKFCEDHGFTMDWFYR